MLRIIYSILYIVLCFGCYEAQEGCLDLRAVNFDIEADRDCCCEFPELRVVFDHLAEGENLDTSLWLINDFGQNFKIQSASFHLSNFFLTDSLDNTYQIADSIYVNGQYYPDDFVLIQNNRFTFVVGIFLPAGNFSEVVFQMGLSEVIKQADPAFFPEGHTLDTSQALYDPMTGYLDWQITFAVDSLNPTLLSLSGSDLNFEIRRDIELDKENGVNVALVFTVDYYRWLRNVDFKNDSENLIIRKIGDNIPFSIELK